MPEETQMEQSVARLMSDDHARLDELWRRCVEGVEAFDPKRVKDAFDVLARGWQRHMQVEDESLLPACEAHGGAEAAQLTAEMRAEHQEIVSMLERLKLLITARDHSTMITIIAGEPCAPTAVFQSHQAKEESALYPMIDRALAQDEKAKLVEQLRARLASE